MLATASAQVCVPLGHSSLYLSWVELSCIIVYRLMMYLFYWKFIIHVRTNLMKPGFKSALAFIRKYTQQATGSASVCVRQFSSTKDALSVGASTDPKKLCGSAFASGRVRSPHIYVVVLLLCIENIDSIYRYIVSYRIVSTAEISTFSIYRYHIFIYHLAEFSFYLFIHFLLGLIVAHWVTVSKVEVVWTWPQFIN